MYAKESGKKSVYIRNALKKFKIIHDKKNMPYFINIACFDRV